MARSLIAVGLLIALAAAGRSAGDPVVKTVEPSVDPEIRTLSTTESSTEMNACVTVRFLQASHIRERLAQPGIDPIEKERLRLALKLNDDRLPFEERVKRIQEQLRRLYDSGELRGSRD